MDVSTTMSLPYRIKNKHLTQQIQKKYKNRHHCKNKTKKANRKRSTKRTQPAYRSSKKYKRKHPRNSLAFLHQHCHELQFKSSDIFTLKDYVKPKPNSEAPYIINHDTCYNLTDLISSSNDKRKKRATPRVAAPTIKPQPTLYSETYMRSTNACKWIKLKCGTFFNSSFYIFNRDADIHHIELTKREENQNIHFIADFIQNTIEQIYSNLILSHDVALVIGAFCRGYLIGRCYNQSCHKDVKFFYEDRYSGVDTYFSISHAFEQNDIVYCSECLLDAKICTMRRCECGETDYAHQFNKYLCYTYEEEKDTAHQIVIDEFKCNCTGHKTRCSRHTTCSKCHCAVCRECELFGWGVDDKGICTKCNNGSSGVTIPDCKGCLHRFDADKMRSCTLCDGRYCDGIKWKVAHELDKGTLQREYDTYLNAYQCECNWKEKYFDAAHNLWYPMYSEWQRRIELGTKDDACGIKETLKCMICDTCYAICNGCDATQKDQMFICEPCHTNHTQTCDLCLTECIYCETEHGKYQGARLDAMEQRRCMECDTMCFICSSCYDECHGEYFGLYLCLECKQTNKKQCVYCNETFINHRFWDKICGKKTDKFRYFAENVRCKQCQCDITNVCNGCRDTYGVRCIHCVNDGICVQCNARIPCIKNKYVSLCALCVHVPRFMNKENNMFLSNRIDKKWKNSHSQKRRKKNQRKNKLNKDGKFMYHIGYNGRYIDGGVVQISSKWKKYRKTNKKRRY